jgi:DNA-directed RNA polymerase subunit RPC12/RpoP
MSKVVEEEREVKCPYCKYKIRYTSEDVRSIWLLKYPYIICPVCGERIFIE